MGILTIRITRAAETPRPIRGLHPQTPCYLQSVSDALEAGTCDIDSVLADPIGSAHYYIIIAFLAVVSSVFEHHAG